MYYLTFMLCFEESELLSFWIHERALRIAYKDNVSSFESSLLMNNSVTVHQRNLQLLIIEI